MWLHPISISEQIIKLQKKDWIVFCPSHPRSVIKLLWKLVSRNAKFLVGLQYESLIEVDRRNVRSMVKEKQIAHNSVLFIQRGWSITVSCLFVSSSNSIELVPVVTLLVDDAGGEDEKNEPRNHGTICMKKVRIDQDQENFELLYTYTTPIRSHQTIKTQLLLRFEFDPTDRIPFR